MDTNRDGHRHRRVPQRAASEHQRQLAERRRDRPQELVRAGECAATENVTITNCQVSGYDPGTLLDGTFGRPRTGARSRRPDRPHQARHRVERWLPQHRHLQLYLRPLARPGDRDRGRWQHRGRRGHEPHDARRDDGAHLRAPGPTRARPGQPGARPRATGPDQQRDRLRRGAALRLDHRGLAGPPRRGRDAQQRAHRLPGRWDREEAALEPPENEAAYPEPSMFGTLPAYGLYVRHARGVPAGRGGGVRARGRRPPFVLQDVGEVHFDHVEAGAAWRAVRVAARRRGLCVALQPGPSRDPPRAGRERGALTITPSASRFPSACSS